MAPRRNGPQAAPKTIVAAARPVDLATKSKPASRQDWQPDAWEYYDRVPEVKQLVAWRANAMSKVRFFVAAHPLSESGDVDVEGDPVPASDPASGIPPAIAELAEAEFARMRSVIGGQAEITRRLEICLEVPGEAYVVGLGERPAEPDGTGGSDEDWFTVSADEIIATERGDRVEWRILTGPNDKQGTPLDPALDDIFRVWQPHARWRNLADSPMLGVLGECEALLILDGQVKAEARSRVHAGILLLANELAVEKSNDLAEDEDDDDGEEPFMAALRDALVSTVEDPSSVASLVPLIVRGPKENIGPDSVRWLDISRQSDSALEARIEQRVLRLARGLDAPVEAVTGHRETTFSNAEQIDQDEFEDYLQPRCVFDANTFTVGFMHPRLRKLKVDPAVLDRLFIWYDASALTAQPDVQGNAVELWDRLAISDAALRRSKGFSEDDAPDPWEVIVRTGLRRGILTADLTAAMILQLAEDAGIDLPEPSAAAPGVPVDGGEVAPAQVEQLASVLVRGLMRGNPQRSLPAIAAASRPSTRDAGRKLANIDYDLRVRLLVASNDAMNRALEKAGNRLKNQASMKTRLRKIGPFDAAATVGLAAIVAAGLGEDDLLAGAFDGLRDQFLTWGDAAFRQAVDIAGTVAGGFTAARRDNLTARLGDSLTAAWAWMNDALLGLARQRMFDPTPAAPPQGEFDPNLRVPPGLVRQAIARAGGTGGLQTGGAGDAWVVVSQGGTKPAGGIATGELVMEAMSDSGVATEAWVWDYGQAPRVRPFPPHLALDGVQFERFDDPQLANGYGYPEVSHFVPGDHAGCSCDVVPILVEPSGPRRVVPEQGADDA